MIQSYRGDKTDITKDKPNVSDIVVGIGWEIKEDYPEDLIVDFAAILADEKSLFHDEKDFIYFNNDVVIKRREEVIKHLGVNKVYKCRNFKDLEQIKISLYDVSPKIENIIFIASIYEARERGYSLKNLPSLHLHIFNEETGDELLFTKLENYFINETCLIFGRLYRFDGEWRYENLSSGSVGTLGTLFKTHYSGDNVEKIGG